MDSTSVPTPPPTDNLIVPEPLATIPPKHHRVRWVLLIAALLVAAGAGVWALPALRQAPHIPRFSELPVGLVADKVSVDAAVVINLPDKVSITPTQADSQITFDPQLKGTWAAGPSVKQLVYKPAKALELGKYYHVTLTAGDIHLAKDFQADEDPKVVAIFPKDGTEAPETTDITLEFNRPMVPLTTLDEQAKTILPVNITPAVPGKFKWVTTRTLKFLPDKHLLRSSHYDVKVSDGFTSMDGLPVAPFEVHFITRPLRYDSDLGPTQPLTFLYDEPVAIRFNQPVDLDKTRGMISVVNSNGQKNVDLTIEYGVRTASLGDQSHLADYTDKTVLNIYQSKDQFGRAKFWDNNTNYQITINGAVPTEGDIKLDESRSFSFNVPDIVQSVQADSQRSSLVEPSLFDPQGHLLINFYESIDKDKSQINAGGLKSVAYGQQCLTDDQGNEIMAGSDCQKTDNKKQLVLSFQDSQFKPGQQFNVELAKVVNDQGLQLNSNSIRESVTVYPVPQVLSTSPSSGDSSASVTDLVICSNTPIEDADTDNFDQMLKSNKPVGKWTWDPSYKVQPLPGPQEKCAVGQYDNHIHYGLWPQNDYQINLHLSDQFGQTVDKTLNFTSGQIASMYYRFNSLQKDYNVTQPGRTKLTFSVENLQYVNLHVCQVSGQTMLNYLNPDLQPAETTSGQQLNCLKSWTKRIDLPTKYWSPNYFQVNLSDIVPNPQGYYVLSFSNPNLRQQNYNYQTNQTESGAPAYERSFLNVTNLAAQEKKVQLYDDFSQAPELATQRKALADSQGNLYWVSHAGSLDAVSGAQVNVYQYNADKKRYTQTDFAQTNDQGIARAAAYAGDGAVIVTSQDGDSTIVSSYSDKFQWASANTGGDKVYIYSDRPIYRPGQEVDIKGLYRIGYDGVYDIFTGKPAHVVIYDSKNTVIQTQDLTISKQGTFNTTLTLANDAPLGTYRVEALGGFYNFDVQEYRPAAFKLDLNSDKNEYIAGDQFTVNVNANYYFGVPVEGGTAEYSVLAQDYYFDRYQDQYFQFGNAWYYTPDSYYGDNFIMRGKVDLDSNGQAKIQNNIDFTKFFQEADRKQSKIFDVRVIVTNTTGQQVSGETSFIVHRGLFYLGANLQNDYFAKNQPNKILLKSVDTQGKEMSVSNISGKISKVSWNYFKRQEVDGSYYYTSEQKLDTVQTFTASTDGQGNFNKDFTVADEGEYLLEVFATDSRGNPIYASDDFYVYGSGVVQVEPLNNESLDIAVASNQTDVGQQASMVVKSPFDHAKALIAVETGRILDYQIVDVDQSLYNYALTVKDSYIPNFYVTVLLLSKGDNPQVRFGQTQYYVNTKQRTISIETKTDKNHYLPGEQVVMDVYTKDSGGNPVPSDVSVAVADMSVLALEGNPKKDPVSFFYDGRPLGVVTSSNFKNILQQAEIPSGTKGGGGANPDDLAAKKRGVFKDTAYWQSDVQTGTDGHAQVTFTLPDNLTTWQVEGVGITQDTKLGVSYSTFDAKKQLMVTQLIPRFVVPGDEFVVGAKVFNQTGGMQVLDVSFDSPSLESLDNKKQTITLAGGQTQTVYFKVRAPVSQTDGRHTVTLTAKNGNFQDSVEDSFPVVRNNTAEAVATSNFSTDNSASEYVWLPNNIVPDRGGLTVQAQATLAGSVPQALNYLVGYPYGCTEQMVSKLQGVAAAKRFTNIKNLGDKFTLPPVDWDGKSYSADDVISIGLSRIMANQNTDGGFAYYPGLQSDYYLTLDVLNALEEIRQAGFKIDDNAESNAVQYAYQYYSSHMYSDLSNNPDLLILTAYTFSNVPSASSQFAALLPKINSLNSGKKYLSEDIGNMSLAYLAILLSRSQTSNAFANKTFDTLENRIVVDGRGAYLGTGTAGPYWYYYETPAKDTALFIQAESLARRDYPDMDKVLRWLRNSRDQDGAWSTTNNTVTVLDALVDFLQFKPETQSNFALELLLNDKSQGKITFGPSNILDSLQANIPMSSFDATQMNKLQFSKTNQNNLPNGFYYDMSFKYFLPVNNIAPRDEGFEIERELYSLDDTTGKTPLAEAKVGQVLRAHLRVTVTKERNLVAVESPIPAGMELVNFNLATENQDLAQQVNNPTYQAATSTGSALAPLNSTNTPVKLAKPGFFSRIWLWCKGLFNRKSSTEPSNPTVGELPDDVYSNQVMYTNVFTPDSVEYHDDRLMLFSQHLEPGVYDYDYYVRALIPGQFQHLPATASELYTPENFGRTRGELFSIKQ